MIAALYVIGGLAAFVVVLATLDILLRTCVSDETIDRIADKVFR